MQRQNSVMSEDFLIQEWTVQPSQGRISRGATSIKLEPRVMDVLVYLAAHPGALVTRDELEHEVWHGALVGYDAVTSTIIKLRKALGDSARKPHFIETVPKRGYRLIATIRSPGEPQQATEQEPTQNPTPRTDVVSGIGIGISRTAGWVLILLLVTSLAVWISLRPWQSITPAQHASAVPETPAMVVLPFLNLSGDPKQEYFADGITEDIITGFSRIAGLKVIAANTSAHFKGNRAPPQEIGAALGVNYVLSGSVRKSTDRVRITALLVEVPSGDHIWAEHYDRKLTDIFKLQDDVTNRIVSTLSVHLTSAEQTQLHYIATNNIAAYDWLLQGQQHAKERSREGNRRAQAAYRRAIELDPGYARAYGALAVALMKAFRNDWAEEASDQETRIRALELAQKAVALDNYSAQAEWALGFVYLYGRQYEKAAEAATQAIALAPNYADAYGLLGSVDNFRGKPELALRQIKKAMTLNPRYPSEYPLVLGRAYFELGQYERAIDALKDAIERNSSALYPHLLIASSYMRLGRTEDAEWEVTQAEMLHPDVNLPGLSNMFPMRNQDDMRAFISDLRKAGLGASSTQ